MNYIDVSEWQGIIDWEKVKPNIDGAILRAGYGLNHIDAQFVRNVTECNRLGIPCGAYWFSYALNTEMAKQEAQYLVSAVKPYRMELPLCFDFEYDSVNTAAKNGATVTKSLATEMTYAFCEAIEEAGYYAMFEYTNGFRKAIYWSYKKMMNHADKYSKAFNKESYAALKADKIPQNELWKYSSFWYKDFDSMAQKTMLRQLISKWGIMSIEMQQAFENDQGVAVVKDGKLAGVEYVDNPEADYVAEPISPVNAVEEDPFK